MKFEIEETLHGPKRVAEMTSLAMDGQRNWRHRGHLGPSDGTRGKMRTRSVAALAVRAWASSLGFPPRESEQLGQATAASVLYAAIINSPSTLKVEGTRSAVAEFFAQYSEHDHIARGVSGLGDTQQVISITWADNGPPELNKNVPGANELDEVIAMRQLNLIALGDWVADQADHPLFLIKALDA
ncbi:hypothetical protein MACH15_00490 [Maricaulis maris]|jgi:predicted negative regulator of RcsB-dependent stress response|nr:hypothetical protein MACH15_00490 [Maricaulis maris]